MKKLVGLILAAAMLLALPTAAGAWLPWARTVQFYVRLDGVNVDVNGDVASRAIANYTDVVATGRMNNRYDSSLQVAIGDDVTEDDIMSYLESARPSDEKVLAKIAEQKVNEGYLKDKSGTVVPWSELTADNYRVEWYVLKFEDDQIWHIDGNLIDLDTDENVEIYIPDDPADIPIDAYTPDYGDPVELRSDYAYIFGRSDAFMEPEDNMRRGEAAAVLYRLLKQNDKLGGFSYNEGDTPVYSDTKGRWDRSALEYMSSIGVYGDSGTISPDQNITRGEAFKMLAMALDFTDDADLKTEQYAAILVSEGYVEGYGDGGDMLTVSDLKLDNGITRAEFCKIYNLIIDRTEDTVSLETADGEAVTAATYGFVDLDSDEWYYEDMLMATSAFADGYVDIAARGVRNVLDDYAK